MNKKEESMGKGATQSTSKNRYTVYYYSVASMDEREKGKLIAAMKGESKAYSLNDVHDYSMKKEGEWKGMISASLNKSRMKNLPHKWNSEIREEDDLQLASNEGLLEKLYIALNKKSHELVVQQNGAVCHRKTFVRIVTGISGVKRPDIAPMVVNRKLSAEDIVLSADLKIAHSPIAPDKLPGGDDYLLSRALMEITKQIEAHDTQTLGITLSTGVGAKIRQKGVYSLGIETFAGLGCCKQAKVKVLKEDQGDGIWYEVLDLMDAHRVKQIDVPMEGRYPNRKKLLDKLAACIDQK